MLNINERLYSHLIRALNRHSSKLTCSTAGETHDHNSVEGYTPETLRVGRTLKHDFEKAGIHLPEDQRSRLTGLVDLERRIGFQIGALPSSYSRGNALCQQPSDSEKALTWQCVSETFEFCPGQNLKTPSKLGYLDMDISGQRKASEQSSKPTLGQGKGSSRVVLHPGTLNSILRREPHAEQREKVQHASLMDTGTAIAGKCTEAHSTHVTGAHFLGR